MNQIPGLTQKQKELYKTVADLRKNFSKLSKNTQVYLTRKPLKKIPRREIEKLEKYLKRKCRCKFYIAGSYLRGLPFSRDIDVIIKIPIERFLKSLSDLYPSIYTKGPNRVSLVIYLPGKRTAVKMDIFKADKDNFIPMLTYTTGSKRFNIIMRKNAKKRGYLLNQNGLYLNNKKIPVSSEKQLFKLVGMKFRYPPQRDWG